MLHCRITSSRPRMYCNPHCNRASTRWYTMDKVRLPDRGKPPKQAQFPDAVGRASTYASKLVMSRGKRFEFARRLALCPYTNSILFTVEAPGARLGAWQQ